MSHFKVSLLLLLSACFAMPLLATGADTKPKQPVATVDGQPIYDEDLAPSIEGQLQPLRNQEFEIKRKALDGLIEQKMLEAAAKKKGLTTEKLIEQEVNASISDPSDAELEGYYYGLGRVGKPFAEVKTQLRDSFKQAKIRQARENYIKTLREGTKVVVLLSAPRVEVAHDPARVRGDRRAGNPGRRRGHSVRCRTTGASPRHVARERVPAKPSRPRCRSRAAHSSD